MEEGNNYEEYANAINEENKFLKNKNLELGGAMAGLSFQNDEERNLIHYRLETDKILERIEHFLKGDQIKFSEDGAYYSEPTKNVLCVVVKDKATNIKYYLQDIKVEKKEGTFNRKICVKIRNADGSFTNVFGNDSRSLMEQVKKLDLVDEGFEYVDILDFEKKPFNEYGVSELMRIISMYLTKETFLSNYTEERIYEIMTDLGNALADFIFCNYEYLGMDTKFKESKYILIVLNILHTIENCYRRAMGGKESDTIQTKGIITQNEGFGNFGGMGGMGGGRSPQKNKWNLFNSNTW